MGYGIASVAPTVTQGGTLFSVMSKQIMSPVSQDTVVNYVANLVKLYLLLISIERDIIKFELSIE